MPSDYNAGQVIPNTTTAGTNLLTNATVLVQIPSSAVPMNGGSIQYTIPKTTMTKTTPYIISTTAAPNAAATQTKMSVQTITSDVFESMIESEPSKVMMPETVSASEDQVILDSEEDSGTLTDDLDETKFLVPKSDAKDAHKKKYITQAKPVRPEYPFICSCGKSYKIKGSLKRHQSYECGVTPSLTCEYCTHKSKYKSDLRKHILQKHAHIDSYSSTILDKSSSSSFSQQLH